MSIDPSSSSSVQSSDIQFILDQTRGYIRKSTNLIRRSLTDQLYSTTRLAADLNVPLDPSLHHPTIFGPRWGDTDAYGFLYLDGIDPFATGGYGSSTAAPPPDATDNSRGGGDAA